MLVVPETEVRLLSNVPLTNTYEHQMTFNDKEAQATYFLNKASYTFLDFTYVREDGSIKVPKGRDNLYACNYVMFRNKDFSSKWFYGFVTKLEYINPNTTKVHFELDVYQTWQFDVDFKPSFIEREHAKRWNADGSPVINTVDEGLNYGKEYQTVDVKHVRPFNGLYFLVIVCTERMDTSATGKFPSVNGLPQPLTFYVHPFRSDGTCPNIIVDGFEITSTNSVQAVLTALYNMPTAVNNVVSLYVTEYAGFPMTYDGSQLTVPGANFDPVTIGSINTLYLANAGNYVRTSMDMGDKYDGFTDVTESKLLMHPYTVTLLTDLKGNYQEIKNEYIQGSNLNVRIWGSVGLSNKVAYSITDYNMNDSAIAETEITLSEGIINNSANDVPIITELLSAYIQGNRNQLENQKDMIAYQGSAGIIANGIGAIGSGLVGNAAGAVMGLSGAVNAAVGAHFQIESLQAKQKDLSAMPPQITKMGSNTYFDYGHEITGLYIIKKEITPEYRKKLADFFKMYGYKTNELKTPNLKSRQHFNFIKTVGANIVGNVPQDDLVVIKRMFDNGVTLWHGDYVGDYSLSNGEV